MTLQIQTWEPTLLSLAHEARHSQAISFPKSIADEALLKRAFERCEFITKQHSQSFYLASSLLPAEKRRAIRALYAFCRTTDDIVDCPDCDARQTLKEWHRSALAVEPPSDDLVSVAWADTRRRYHIPLRLAEQLIDGVACDLDRLRYATFDDLAAYAYGVASTVGLMSMHIIGYNGAEAIPYAIKLGVALQITNILRDVGEDWQAGRLYLPENELSRFGISEADVAGGIVSDRWRAFMRFQIVRNRRLYAEAWPGIRRLNKDGRVAIAVAGELYRGILADIAAHDYDVFSRRAHMSTARKLVSLLGISLRNR